MIDVIGHFGSRFSMATVAAEIARGLKEQGKLGKIINFDNKIVDAYDDLVDHCGNEVSTSSYALFVMLPVDHITVATKLYKKAAVYISPNNDRLGLQYVENLRMYDRVYVPSRWCAETVTNAGHPEEKTVTIPIGCEDTYFALRQSARQGIESRLQEPPNVLHMTTDGFLPGRKGTIEVIKAWAECREQGVIGDAKLVLHAPQGVSDEVTQYACYYQEFEPEVSVVAGPPRGEPFENLTYFMRDFDIVVLPSRCEGFGMMILAALALGISTITTNWTGQMDFVQQCGGWRGPSGFIGNGDGRYGAAQKMGPVENKWDLSEVGVAPLITSSEIAEELGKLMLSSERKRVFAAGERDLDVLKPYSWSTLRKRWAKSLIEWSEA